MFSPELTAEDSKNGFVFLLIANPDGSRTPWESNKVKAVICQLDPSRRIIKLRYPDGMDRYQLQFYGKLYGVGPSWLGVGSGLWERPDKAVAIARNFQPLGTDAEVVLEVPDES